MTASGEPDPDDSIPTAVKAAAVLGALFVVVAFGLLGGRAAFSVGVGAVIAIANLVAMRAIIRNLLRAPDEETGAQPKAADAKSEPEATEKSAAEHKAVGKRGGVAWGVFAVLKMVGLFGSVAILLTRGMVDPMPLVVGYGVLPLGIALGSLWSNLRPTR